MIAENVSTESAAAAKAAVLKVTDPILTGGASDANEVSHKEDYNSVSDYQFYPTADRPKSIRPIGQPQRKLLCGPHLVNKLTAYRTATMDWRIGEALVMVFK